MAVNVYLVFFRRYDAHRLKRLYWVYAIICYGLPFLPAIFCLFYKTKAKGKMYGNATVSTLLFEVCSTNPPKLWCWIDNDWAAIRIYSYYAPIWVAIHVALIIYIRVGIEIFQKRSQLRAMSGGGDGPSTSNTGHPEPAFTGIRTTEVEVTTTDPPLKTPALTYARAEKPAAGKDQYTITISARDRVPPTPRGNMFPRRPSSMDKIKWAYTKCAMLFAISILITWVPASVNRVYGLRYPKNSSFALNVGSAIVLPLQGFWNTIIYFTTSLSICRSVIERFKSRNQPRGFTVLDEGSEGRERKRDKETDGTIELSHRSLGSLSESV
jgi:hypothetical protein